ncbi:DUF2829 domain-containing protein [Phaeospirillum tilakii]|uniref:DUF2829 domain-containing protein n=1 Tax=Phaeospirillum tilakii TaxID=741673 RepID=A0ABW5C694_9PROT
MKTYQCHKRVKAAQIASISDVIHSETEGYRVVTTTEGEEIHVKADILAHWQGPVEGNAIVEYEDGYRALSPWPAFEGGYTELRPMTGVQFRKKPVVIQAIKFDGTNVIDVHQFIAGSAPERNCRKAEDAWDDFCELARRDGYPIQTLEGEMRASVGDWIIRGVKGEYYPCKPDIFETTYEAATADAVAPDRPDNLPFGDALLALKAGERVARAGWDGKGMWLCLCDFSQDTITFPEFGIDHPHRKLPWIGMKASDNGFVPWLASQTDMLATDWQIVGA